MARKPAIPSHTPHQPQQNPVCEFAKLDSAWKFSAQLTESLESAFKDLSVSIACIAICGSVKRMEAHSASDLDLIVVVDDREAQLPDDELKQIQHSIWKIVSEHAVLKQFAAPKAGGLFSLCASWRNLIDPQQRGIVDADITTFGHRMHILMDAYPVAGTDSFRQLQKDIFTWYSEESMTSQFGGCPPFDWLKQDILRYWHSIHARAYWLFHDNAQKSATVNLKLRSSRLLQIVAFLSRLRAVERLPLEERLNAILQSGPRSPLETIIPLLSDQRANQLLSAWEKIWQALEGGINDPADATPLISHLRTLRDQTEHLGFRLL